MELQEELDQANRDLLDAAKRIQQLTGAHVHVDLHKLDQHAFMAAAFLGSDDAEDGTPSYVKVPSHENGYLNRLIYRSEKVLFQYFMEVPAREEAGAGA